FIRLCLKLQLSSWLHAWLYPSQPCPVRFAVETILILLLGRVFSQWLRNWASVPMFMQAICERTRVTPSQSSFLSLATSSLVKQLKELNCSHDPSTTLH